jgi:hypothetical protein
VYYGRFLNVRRGIIPSIIAVSSVIMFNAILRKVLSGEITAPTADIPFFVVFAIGALAASIYATTLSGLADDNDGHLPVTWTRPYSRIAQACAIFAVDACAIFLMFALSTATALVVFLIYGAGGHFAYEPAWWGFAARFAAAPFAFYAIAQGLTASLAKPAGLVRGMVWGGLFFLIILSVTNLPPVIHQLVSIVDYINPMTYVAIEVTDLNHISASPTATALVGLAAITFAGLLGAVAQWRRLEA